MNFLQNAYNINKIILNLQKIIMTSYFQNGAKKYLFGILSNSARYRTSKYNRYIKTGIYLLLYLIIFQNIKTNWVKGIHPWPKKIFLFDRLKVTMIHTTNPKYI